MLAAKSSVVLFLQILSGLHRVRLTSSWGLSEQKFSKELCYSKPCGSLRVGAWPPENAICSFDCYHYYYYWLVPMFIKAEKDLVRDFDTLGFKESIIRDVCQMFMSFACNVCMIFVLWTCGSSVFRSELYRSLFGSQMLQWSYWWRWNIPEDLTHTLPKRHCSDPDCCEPAECSKENNFMFFKIMSFLFFGNNYRNRTLFLICFCNIKWLSPPHNNGEKFL